MANHNAAGQAGDDRVMHIEKFRASLALPVFCLWLAACGATAKAPDAEVTLAAMPAETGEIARIINASGKVKPAMTVQVGSEISGKIVKIEVDFNDSVKAGDVLAVIDAETFTNRVEQQKAGLENSRSSIRVQEAAVARAQVNAEQARLDAVRVETLFRQSAASAARMEAAQQRLGVAESDLALAEAQLDGAQANLKQGEAGLKTSRVDLGRTVIRSPIDGIVIDRKVDAGQTVAASFSSPELFVIANDLSEIQVEAAIVESDVAGLGEGDAVSFTVDAYPERNFRGAVKQLRLNSIEEQNIVTYTAVVTAENPERLLMPGMTASLQITTESRKNILRIPAAAERFRPRPDEIKTWQAETPAGASDDEFPGWAQIEADLAGAGVAAGRIAAVKKKLIADTAETRKAINDPEESFRRTPNLKRLAEQTRLAFEATLAPNELGAYRQKVASAGNLREADVWVKAADGKMQMRSVGLGLSDGAFVEVIRGLKAGESVVTGIDDPSKAEEGEERGPGGRPGPGGRRRF
jgi:HlyD family secretion protein